MSYTILTPNAIRTCVLSMSNTIRNFLTKIFDFVNPSPEKIDFVIFVSSIY